MNSSDDNETWVVEAGGGIVEKHSSLGYQALTQKDRLLYWLWWADYMMRNAGDFGNAAVLDQDFQMEVAFVAEHLGLAFTKETFSLPRNDLEKEYFDRFDAVCDEIRNA